MNRINLVHTAKRRSRMTMLERGDALLQAGRLWVMPGGRSRRVVDPSSVQGAKWVVNFAEVALPPRYFCSV